MSGPLAVAVATVAQQSGPTGVLGVALQLYELVGGVLGAFIAYLAYQGYRRNDSRPMLFVSLGFALALAVPLVLSSLYLGAAAVVPLGGQVALQVLIQTLEIAGLLSIVYGLRL